MKRCDKIGNQAFKYWEGTLTTQERDEIKAHLQSCPACAARFSLAKRTWDALHRLPQHKTSPDFDIVLHAKLRQAAHQERNYSRMPVLTWNWRLPAYAAAAMLFVAAGIVIQRQSALSPLTASSPVTVESRRVEVQQPAVLSAGTTVAAAPRSRQAPIKNYVMQKIPMQELLRVNRQNPGFRQATLDQNQRDTARVRDRASRMPVTDIQPVNASIHF